MTNLLPSNYAEILADLKQRVLAAQIKAATAVNRELIALYLEIGRQLTEQHTWGAGVVERLARDLRGEFPDMSGFSRTNLFYMKQVFAAWRGAEAEVQQLVGQVPWGHHIALVAKVQDPEARVFYLRHAVAHGWSRSVLTVQIESLLHERQGRDQGPVRSPHRHAQIHIRSRNLPFDLRQVRAVARGASLFQNLPRLPATMLRRLVDGGICA